MNFGARRFGQSSLIARLMVGTAFSAVAITGAFAQPADNVETVVVTGTSIRGAQPTGSNLITVDRATIESTGAQNVQQLLSTVPQINTFGGSGQGGSNSDFTGGFAPAIHGIGGGSSSATLVLIDGHRFPTQGLTEAQADPTVIPAAMLQRVEVLPDGASSIYGSDAVAGVINFITRKDFTGMEFNVQAGIASHYNTFEGSAMLGHAWTGGSVLAGFDYSNQSNLTFGSRKFNTTRQDLRLGAADPSLFTGVTGTASRGVNFQNFNCSPATIAASSSASAFYYQNGGYGGTGLSTATAGVQNNGACDQTNGATTTLLPATVRNGGMIQVRQELSDNLVIDIEAVYGTRVSNDHQSRGTINAQVFGPSAAAANATQINPFYVGNATTGNATEFVRYDFNALLGPGAYSKTFDSNAFVAAGLTWDLGDNRELVIGGVDGSNFNYQHIAGVVSGAEALLALNGTTNTNGTPGTTSEQDVFGLGTVYPGSRVLNTNNALDVWNPVSTNRTSAAVIASLKDGGRFTNAQQGLQDLNVKFDGPVFDMPAGPVKIATGAEFMHSTMDEYGTTNNSVGPSTSNSAAYYFREGRTVWSAFLEVSTPLISPQMGVPLVQSFSLDVSGRYDTYSDVGDTKNPKVAFDWVIADGFKARGSYGTSFVAPTIHDAQAVNSQSNITASGNFANTVIPFGDPRPFNGGAGLAGTWVSTPTSCAAGNGTVVNSANQTITPVGGVYTGAFGCKTNFAATNGTGTSAGLNIAGGNGHLHPATGRSWEGGFDIDAGKFANVMDGLIVSLTYFDVTYRGLITNQQTQNNIPQLTYFAPIGGWTPQSAPVQAFVAGHPLTIAMPSTIWVLTDTRLQNAFNAWFNGIDFGVNYSFPTDTWGNFKLGLNGTELLRYSQQGGNTGPVLNTLEGPNSPRYNPWDLSFRADIGWAFGALATDLAMNYIHGTQTTNSFYPYSLPGPDRGFYTGSPATFTSAGVEHLGTLLNFDLNVNYALPKGFVGLPDIVADGTSVSLTVQNILDTAPPFDAGSSAAAGANGYSRGNPIGRLVTIGLRKKL
jgi:iron complex outermembrane receptor protein